MIRFIEVILWNSWSWHMIQSSSSDELVFTSLNQIFFGDCDAKVVAGKRFLTVVAPSYKNNQTPSPC